MTSSIWKFPLEMEDEQIVEMPKVARILCVQVQHGQPYLWAEVIDQTFRIKRRIYMRGTGHDCGDAYGAPYIGTIQLAGGDLIFHIFDGGEVK